MGHTFARADDNSCYTYHSNKFFGYDHKKKAVFHVDELSPKMRKLLVNFPQDRPGQVVSVGLYAFVFDGTHWITLRKGPQDADYTRVPTQKNGPTRVFADAAIYVSLENESPPRLRLRRNDSDEKFQIEKRLTFLPNEVQISDANKEGIEDSFNCSGGKKTGPSAVRATNSPGGADKSP